VFKAGFWRDYRKNLRVRPGVSNLVEREHLFSANSRGFNAGFHGRLMLGHSYEFSFALPH
jgi:hypothetical protein